MLKFSIAFFAIAASLSAGDRSDWQNLEKLSAGQSIEVSKKSGDSLKGAFLSFTDGSITIQGRQNTVTVPRADVARVRKGSHRGRNTWIGAGIGAGGGAVAGAALGSRLANESGGDFDGLRGAIVGGCAAGGALLGAVIGFSLGGRRAEVYRAP